MWVSVSAPLRRQARGGEKVIPGLPGPVLGQTGLYASPLHPQQQIAQQLLLVVEVGIEGGTVYHGPLADVGDGEGLEGPFRQQLLQRPYQGLPGPALPQVQGLIFCVGHVTYLQWLPPGILRPGALCGLSYANKLHMSR